MTSDRSRHSRVYGGWVYAEQGDYHRDLDPNWSYAPTYLMKMRLVRRELKQLPPEALVLDAGCGEGVLVEEFRTHGLQIEGLDLNYESDLVKRGSVLDCPYEADNFDAVLFLDVLEHLQFCDQPAALKELKRVLKPGGRLIATVPNLSHLNSRFRMLLKGKLHRTDTEDNHPGERPYWENRRLFQEAGFSLLTQKGITFTVPILYSRLICRHARRFRWLHDALQVFSKPSLAMYVFQVWIK